MRNQSRPLSRMAREGQFESKAAASAFAELDIDVKKIDPAR
jgi:hypothetical protein